MSYNQLYISKRTTMSEWSTSFISYLIDEWLSCCGEL